MCSQRLAVKGVFLVFLFTLSWDNKCLGQQQFFGESQFAEKMSEDGEPYSENMIHPFMHHPPRPPQYDHPPFQPPPPMMHAGLPRQLAAYPVPSQGSPHELQLNVSWLPPFGPRPRDYSLEVNSVTNSEDCDTPMCYEYNIPGDLLWHLVPSVSNPVSETCAVRPGCSYRVRLIAHPWDGHTAANTFVQVDECVLDVCSCAHAPRLPSPLVSATTVSVQGQLFSNVSWSLPPPLQPLRLPPGLKKTYYIISIGKQMVSDAHPSPWFANTVSRKVDADGTVFSGDTPRWLLVPIGERRDKLSDERSGQREEKTRNTVLDVRWLARVNVVDERGCVGPAGNATAYDPVIVNKIHFGAYAVWAAFGGLFMLAMVAILAVSSRMIKRTLKSFRSAPVSAPLNTLSSAWFPMQLRIFMDAYYTASCVVIKVFL